MTRVIDSNILIYAFNKSSDFYETSKKLIKTLIKNGELGICTISLIEFFQVTTNHKKFSNPLETKDAQIIISSLNESQQIETLDITKEIIDSAFETIVEYGIHGYDIYDHIIAESCKFYNVKELYTFNVKDFKRYKYLKVIKPL
jgi:predicted nucleic acid-binding protein